MWQYDDDNWFEDDFDKPEVWLGMLGNFDKEDEQKLQNAVDKWNKICNHNDRLIIKQDAYDCKGKPIKRYVALHRETPCYYSDLSEFWKLYKSVQ